MTPLDEALALLRDCEDNAAIGEPDFGVIEQRIRALRTRIANESAAAQGPVDPETGRCGPAAQPASAAPSTSTTKYPPDFPATVTKDLMQHSVAAPTPLTDALSRGHYQSVPIEVAYGEMFEHARDLERKLAEAHAKIDRLMLEYCPEDMTPERVENWGRHQRSVTKR